MGVETPNCWVLLGGAPKGTALGNEAVTPRSHIPDWDPHGSTATEPQVRYDWTATTKCFNLPLKGYVYPGYDIWSPSGLHLFLGWSSSPSPSKWMHTLQQSLGSDRANPTSGVRTVEPWIPRRSSCTCGWFSSAPTGSSAPTFLPGSTRLRVVCLPLFTCVPRQVEEIMFYHLPSCGHIIDTLVRDIHTGRASSFRTFQGCHVYIYIWAEENIIYSTVDRLIIQSKG